MEQYVLHIINFFAFSHLWDNEIDLCEKNLLFHHFIDDISHNIWFYFVIAKGENIEIFKKSKVHIEKEFESKTNIFIHTLMENSCPRYLVIF
jgi:hypothetical protein